MSLHPIPIRTLSRVALLLGGIYWLIAIRLHSIVRDEQQQQSHHDPIPGYFEGSHLLMKTIPTSNSQPTAPERCFLRGQWIQTREVPQLIILGAQKAGTSALADFLACHPQMRRSMKKEPHFLDWEVVDKKDENRKMNEVNVSSLEELFCWYRWKYAELFNVNQTEDESNRSILTFEKTPSYLFQAYSIPDILLKICPWKPKLVVLLRNPVDRAWSQYQMEKGKRQFNLKGRSFEELIETELNVMRDSGLTRAPSLQAYINGTIPALSPSMFGLLNLTEQEEDRIHKRVYRRVFLANYIQKGMYAIQLRRWKRMFGTKLLVIKYEDLYGSKSQEYHDYLFDFIAVSRLPVPEAYSRLSTKSTLLPRTRAYLESFFRPYSDLLANELEDESWIGGWDV